MPSFIKSDTHITLLFDDGDTCTVYESNKNYNDVCVHVKNGEWDDAKLLASPAEMVKRSIADIEHVAIQDGLVTYDDVPMHSTLTDRILQMHAEGLDIAPMALFLENLMDNPSYRAVNELYTFLSVSNLPITEDGHFLAYKRVGETFMDLHSGKFDNSPGTIVEMRRNTVNEDKDKTCSAGLHFCSREYLPHYGTGGSNKIVMLKINPADVVAIPTDYNNSKGRCCKYYVVEEMGLDFDSDGNLPEENLESAFKDTRTVVNDFMIEQLNLADALLGDGEPKIIATFDGATEAMHKLNIDSSSITQVCNGGRKSAGGFAWRWSYDNPLNRLEDDVQEDDVQEDDDIGDYFGGDEDFGCFGDYFAGDEDYHE